MPHDVQITGVDGCRGGWLAVTHPLDQPEVAIAAVIPDIAALISKAEPGAHVVGIDMPIGLPDRAIRGGRQADVEVRKILGQRQSSVFAVPARAAVACTDYTHACTVALAHSDPPRKVSKQIFHLFPKIREVDAAITPDTQSCVVEIHPEAAFWALNAERPLAEPKKVKSKPWPPGLAVRAGLLAAAGYRIPEIRTLGIPASIAGQDDLLDAFAVTWSAARLARGTARRFPVNPPTDGRGLYMEIWC